MAGVIPVIVYIVSVGVVMLTGGGQGVEAVLWVGGGVAVAQMFLRTRGQI